MRSKSHRMTNTFTGPLDTSIIVFIMTSKATIFNENYVGQALKVSVWNIISSSGFKWFEELKLF